MNMYVESNYHDPLYADGDISVAGYVEDGYYIDGYTDGGGSTPVPTVSIDISGATKFFVKGASTKTKTEIVNAVLVKLGELSKEIALVSDLRDGTQYAVIVASKQAELSSGNSFIDIAGGGVSVEIIQA
ncbi:MAG: hypothetical protein EOL93_00685 [Epsilonproteobacteria bacterium]|nr:hypothetical protein [Campylobacterota bacterium]